MSKKNEQRVIEIIKEFEEEQNELWFRAKIVVLFVNVRKKKGLTQAEVAKRIGVVTQQVARFETCSNSPTLSFLVKYAKALDEDLNIFLGNQSVLEVTNE